ncbi:unnamed protein product, partial [Polarella glacialis]
QGALEPCGRRDSIEHRCEFDHRLHASLQGHRWHREPAGRDPWRVRDATFSRCPLPAGDCPWPDDRLCHATSSINAGERELQLVPDAVRHEAKQIRA